jgi:hypothetical protein
MIEYRFRVPNAAVFTLYSYSKTLEYRFRVPTAGSLRLVCGLGKRLVLHFEFDCSRAVHPDVFSVKKLDYAMFSTHQKTFHPVTSNV